MLAHIRRRLIGYAPAAVAYALRRREQEHRANLLLLENDLAQARQETTALYQRLTATEQGLHAADLHVQLLTSDASAPLVLADEIRGLRAQFIAEEAELAAKVQQLSALLGYLDDMQARFRSDLDQLSDYYRTILTGLRRAMDNDRLWDHMTSERESAG